MRQREREREETGTETNTFFSGHAVLLLSRSNATSSFGAESYMGQMGSSVVDHVGWAFHRAAGGSWMCRSEVQEKRAGTR